jgi:hypothetical protein
VSPAIGAGGCPKPPDIGVVEPYPPDTGAVDP